MPKKRGLDHLEGIIAKLSKFVIMISVQENLFKKMFTKLLYSHWPIYSFFNV